MSKAGKQVMDIKPSKGLAQSSNEELRAWTDKGWEQAMREGNYDRSREHLNFEIQRGGIVTPIDKSRPLTRRMAENLASRGIKDPNEGLDEPRYRTVVNFIFGGSTERMRELAFGNQEVDFESKKGNEHIRRMPEIEEWAKDIYRFVADKYGEENIISFIVHCDEKTLMCIVRFFLLTRKRSSHSRKSSMAKTVLISRTTCLPCMMSWPR